MKFTMPVLKKSPLMAELMDRYVYRRLPECHFPQFKADDLGNKLCGRLALLDSRQRIIPITQDEWFGIHALERDDEL